MYSIKWHETKQKRYWQDALLRAMNRMEEIYDLMVDIEEEGATEELHDLVIDGKKEFKDLYDFVTNHDIWFTNNDILMEKYNKILSDDFLKVVW